MRRLRRAQQPGGPQQTPQVATTTLGSDDPADALDEAEHELQRARSARFALLLDAVKSLADVHVSSSMAAVGPLRNEGRNRQVVALLGFASSLISIFQMWNAKQK